MFRTRAITAALLAISLAASVGCSSSAGTASEATTTTTPPAARPSAGCARPDEAFAHVGDNGAFSSDGLDRTFSLEVPSDRSASEPLPLVVDLHGARAGRLLEEGATHFGDVGREQ